MSQFVSAGAFVIVPQEDIPVQVLQTVPAEGVFTAFAQHLSAALVPLDVDAAHRTLFDGRFTVRAASAFAPGGEGHHGLQLRTGVLVSP